MMYRVIRTLSNIRDEYPSNVGEFLWLPYQDAIGSRIITRTADEGELIIKFNIHAKNLMDYNIARDKVASVIKSSMNLMFEHLYQHHGQGD